MNDALGETIPCKIKGSFRMKGIRATNPVAVGDSVEFELVEDGTGVIRKIHERSNYIIRRSSNLSREYQLIASNVDQAILLVSLVAPRTLLAFIDRFLVSAEAFRIPVILVFNKLDLYGEEELEELELLKILYGQIGYPVVAVSLKQQQNLEELSAILKDKVTVVSGNSGVGKSTLMNTLDPTLSLRTSDVSEAHSSGKHTTTFAEMFSLPWGGSVIDTPGIKGFGMVDIEREELFHFFPEIFRESSKCKFHNCLHEQEPECAVKQAVKEFRISESRYFNYLDLLSDMQDKYRK